ncbi:hypothetical protein CLF_107847, partial [Clonorchis sinensis]
QLKVLHQAASCSSCYDIPDIAIHVHTCNGLLIRLLKTVRQPTTGFAPRRANSVMGNLGLVVDEYHIVLRAVDCDIDFLVHQSMTISCHGICFPQSSEIAVSFGLPNVTVNDLLLLTILDPILTKLFREPRKTQGDILSVKLSLSCLNNLGEVFGKDIAMSGTSSLALLCHSMSPSCKKSMVTTDNEMQPASVMRGHEVTRTRFAYCVDSSTLQFSFEQFYPHPDEVFLESLMKRTPTRLTVDSLEQGTHVSLLEYFNTEECPDRAKNNVWLIGRCRFPYEDQVLRLIPIREKGYYGMLTRWSKYKASKKATAQPFSGYSKNKFSLSTFVSDKIDIDTACLNAPSS